MGRKRARKAAFLKEHPICCFCGGRAPAAEPDHIPSRASFTGRHWPEGYEFPACSQCNRATRYDEQVVAMLARLYPDPETNVEAEETRESIRAVAYNSPEVLLEMQPTHRQLRNAEKRYGLKRGERQGLLDIPALYIGGPLVNQCVMNFARKLFCALYYKHAEAILDPEGGIAVRWFSNLQVEADEIPRSLADVLNRVPTLHRAKTGLEDQFFYRWGISDTGRIAVFLAFFRQSFAILGFVAQDAGDIIGPDESDIVRPCKAQQAH